MNKKRNTGMGGSVTVRRTITGVACSCLVTMVVTAVLAGMISKKLIPEEKIDYCRVVILLISTIAGVDIAILKCDNRVLTGMYIGVAYLAMLMTLTSIFFGGEYQRIGVTSSIVLIACFFAAMLRKNGSKNIKFRKSKNKRC